MKNKFPKSFIHYHDKESILYRLKTKGKYSYLKDFVYGAIDGTVTTFAVVSGVVGAGLSIKAILVLGVANLLADGFSMAMSNYLGTSTENQELDLLREFESYQIETFPEGEKEEVRHILKTMGFKDRLLEDNIKFYTSDKERWIELMIKNEYGLSGNHKNALKAASYTLIAFVVFGFLPLTSYIFSFKDPFLWSSFLSIISFALVGSIKSKWTSESYILSSVKTILLGIAASAIAYFVGDLIESLVR
jgi:VIT1/CCC1 family predicted Fe2+/Mn2+ transporter